MRDSAVRCWSIRTNPRTTETGRPPIFAEIGERIGTATLSVVQHHVLWLVKHGYLLRPPGAVRDIRLTKRGREAAGVVSPRDVLAAARQHLDDLPAPVREAVEACEVAA